MISWKYGLCVGFDGTWSWYSSWCAAQLLSLPILLSLRPLREILRSGAAVIMNRPRYYSCVNLWDSAGCMQCLFPDHKTWESLYAYICEITLKATLRGADHNAFLPQWLSLTVLYSGGLIFYNTNRSNSFHGDRDKQVTGILLNSWWWFVFEYQTGLIQYHCFLHKKSNDH